MRVEITIGRDSKMEHAISGTLETGERFLWTCPRSRHPITPDGWLKRARERLALPASVLEARMTWVHATCTRLDPEHTGWEHGVRLAWEVPTAQEEVTHG